MKIEINTETNDFIVDMFDGITVSTIRHALDYLEDSHTWEHPDDKKQNKKTIKACKELIKYFRGD